MLRLNFISTVWIFIRVPLQLYMRFPEFYMVLGQEQKGEEALKKAVRSDESNFWYKQTLAAYYQRKRDWAKAIAVYDDMAHQFPSRLEPLMALVDLYNQTKSYAQVVSVLNRLEEAGWKV